MASPQPSTPTPTPDDTAQSTGRGGAAHSAMIATYIAFAGSGFGFASWASRIPQLRDQLDLSAATLGWVLLSVAAGAVLALPLSGPAVTRLGSRRTVASMSVLMGASLVLLAGGYLMGVLPVVFALFLLGFANGAWDVAMNVQGAAVERRLNRSIMSRFHAGFSVGTVAGALVGAAMVALSVPVPAHLLLVAVVTVAVVPWGARAFLPDAPHAAATDAGAGTDPDADLDAAGAVAAGGEAPRSGTRAAWTDRRTVLVGFFVLAFAFAEGVGNDWIALAMIDGYGQSAAVGTLAFAGFLAAMTTGRWFGPGLLERYGRVRTVRVMAVLAIAGLLIFVFAPNAGVALVGGLMWGLGVALGFPVGMSAGADDPARAAARVSVIASIGYCAFLAGPPLVGFLGDRFTVLKALLAVGVLLTVALVLAGNVAPLHTQDPAGPASTPGPDADADRPAR